MKIHSKYDPKGQVVHITLDSTSQDPPNMRQNIFLDFEDAVGLRKDLTNAIKDMARDLNIKI